jgi:hypothetical protein
VTGDIAADRLDRVAYLGRDDDHPDRQLVGPGELQSRSSWPGTAITAPVP